MMAEMPDRAEMEQFLEGMEYPLSKRTLLELARQRGGGAGILALIERLPERTFEGHAGLMADLEQARRSGR